MIEMEETDKMMADYADRLKNRVKMIRIAIDSMKKNGGDKAEIASLEKELGWHIGKLEEASSG